MKALASICLFSISSFALPVPLQYRSNGEISSFESNPHRQLSDNDKAVSYLSVRVKSRSKLIYILYSVAA